MKSADPASGLAVNELVLAFMRHADGHYVKGGKPTSEIHCLKAATRPLVEFYGFTAVDEFGPLMLKAVRQKYVDAGWVRESCNKGVNRIRTNFKWGVENELVAPATLQKLQAVAALLKTLSKDSIDADGFMMIESDLRLLEPVQMEIDKFDQRLADLAWEDERVKLLMTIPGVSLSWARLWWLPLETSHASSQGMRTQVILG